MHAEKRSEQESERSFSNRGFRIAKKIFVGERINCSIKNYVVSDFFVTRKRYMNDFFYFK